MLVDGIVTGMKRLNLVKTFNHPKASAAANAAQIGGAVSAGVVWGRSQRSKNKGRSSRKRSSF